MSEPATEESGESVLVSACLLGRNCTYKGGHNFSPELAATLEAEGATIVPFCPEDAGGLPTPRPAANLTASAAEVVDGTARVVDIHGADVTKEFLAGARAAAETCAARGIRRAFLKERSPSCGCAATHVHGEVTAGPGVTVEVLRRGGVECHGA